MLDDILAHLYPEIFNESYKSKINIQNRDKEKLDKYQKEFEENGIERLGVIKKKEED